MERSKEKILEEIEKYNASNEGDLKRHKLELHFLALKVDALKDFKEKNLSVDLKQEPYTLYFDNEESKYKNLKEYIKSDEFENDLKDYVVKLANSSELIHPEATSGRYTNYDLASYGVIDEKDIKTHEISKEDINSALIAEFMENIKKVKEDIGSLIKNNGDNDIILEKDWDKLSKKYDEKFIKLLDTVENERTEKIALKKRIEEFEKC